MRNTFNIHLFFIWNLRALIMVLIPIIFIQSCQEKIEWELEMENELRLIVEGKITNERKAHEVKLSLPVYEINGVPEPVTDALVYISDGDSVHILNHDQTRPGVYVTSENVQGVIDKRYYLLVRVRGHEFRAAAKMKAVTPIRVPGYRKVNETPPLYELYFNGNDEPSRITIEMDWSHLPGFNSLPDEKNHAIIYGYYFSPLTFDVNEFFSPSRERVFFPPGTKVVITKESLSPGYEEYLRGMLSETAWNGGLFDVKPGDPFTNLSNGAMGYFTATSVIRDTVVFSP